MGERAWGLFLSLGAALVVAGCASTGTPPAAVDWAPEGRSSALDPEPVPEPGALPLAGSGSTNDNALLIHTEPGEIPRLELATDPNQKLPLEHTHVKARLTGYVAEVEVSQTYKNPGTKPIEAVYVFPLPENSAVHALRMVIGRRIIEGEVKERGAARRTYETARAQGFTAALLEQERPNVFTQSVANIAPGEKIDVVVRYVQDLSYDAGQYEFVFPMVVGPRYMPGRALDAAPSGSGTQADTTRVPDASRISPPYVGTGERSGHDISIEVVADTTLAVGEIDVPTHEVLARKPADGTLKLTLAEKKSLPNRDFVLRYRAAAKEPKASLFLARGSGNSGFFSLVVEPPEMDVDRVVGRREVVFVVDVSGSMSGVPLGMCKRAMRTALGMLRPVDTFNVITFAGSTARAFPTPRAANAANLKHAFDVVDAMEAGGGTEMLDAISAALSSRVEPGRHRYVFFLTDGYVGNEEEIMASASRFVAAVEQGGQRARVFSYGVGSSVNRHLIDGLARAGKGTAVVATMREDPSRAVNGFFRIIDQPILENLRLELGQLRPDNLFPVAAPDLFASHPVIVHGTYTGEPTGTLSVAAALNGREIHMPVTVRKLESVEDKAPSVLGRLWARSKVTALDEAMWERGSPAVRREIIELGERFHLVTRFTSLVAVDRSRRVGDGRPETVVQPAEAPEGVDLSKAGGVRPKQKIVSSSEVTISERGEKKRDGSGGSRSRTSKPAAAATAPTQAPAPPPPAAAVPRPAPEPESAAGPEDDKVVARADEGAEYDFDESRREESSAPGSNEAYGKDLERESAQEQGEDGAVSEPQSTATYARAEQKRGCGCRVVGGPSSEISWLVAAFGFVVLFFRRRGRRLN